MTSQKNLLPCPFCGGRGQLECNYRSFIHGQTEKVALVRCLDCGARASRVPLKKYNKTSHSKEAEQEAIDNWNNRPTPQI